MKNSLRNFTVVALWSFFSFVSAQTTDELLKGKEASVFLVETTKSAGTGSGTAFACIYRNQEFVVTNLHVVEAVDSIKIKSISGKVIELTEKIIVSDNADICLMAIKGKFADLGITPLEFMDKVAEESKLNDEIVCLGNSLGNGVITSTKGTIKAFGNPRLEITAPVVKGNSGGPILHANTGKVIGLVTEAIVNNLDFDELGAAAKESEDSPLEEISYFGHRVDSVSKWVGTSMVEYQKQSNSMQKAVVGLAHATLFMVDKPGWEADPRLTAAWKDYSKFLDQAAAKNRTVQVSQYDAESGVMVRRDVRLKGLSVSQADFDTAYAKFKRAIDWKIKTDHETLVKAKPIGYLQNENRKFAMDFSGKVIQLFNQL